MFATQIDNDIVGTEMPKKMNMAEIRHRTFDVQIISNLYFG